MRPAVLTIDRADLVAEGACSAWLALYDEVVALRGGDAPLAVELTPLAQVWLSLPLGESGSAWAWLRARGVVGAVSAPRASLRGAYLRGAYLSGAYLRGANLIGANLIGANLIGADLSGADLSGADLRGAYLRGADLRGADLRGAYLSGAYLSGAYLRGADLSGANRYPDDPPVTGWVVRDGRMERAT